MSPRTRSALSFIVRFLITALLIAFVISRVDLQQVASDFRRVAWWGPVAAGMLVLVNIGLQWFRWHYLIRIGGLGLRPATSLRMLMAGLPMGLLTPGRMGELGRGAAVAGDHDAVVVAGLTALERSFSTLGSLGIAIAAMIASGYGTGWKWVVIAALYGGLAYTFFHPYRLAQWTTALLPVTPGALATRLRKLTARFLGGWELAGRKAALGVFTISVLQTATAIVQITICYMAAVGGASLLKVTGTWAVVLGAKHFLPVTVGDLGVREGLAVAIFANRNLPTSAALVAALLIYVINILSPSLIGALVLARRRSIP
jgi:uncharacterized protein (TIRG00374 family)